MTIGLCRLSLSTSGWFELKPRFSPVKARNILVDSVRVDGHHRQQMLFQQTRRRANGVFGWLLLAIGLSAQHAPALTLAELRADPNLTPERFIKYFADFRFKLARDVRKPENFLATRSGDCDDFATLAADLLREKGYTTRLVAVFMPDCVHVVCYVKEANSYLDYNCRKQVSPLAKCDEGLTAIAASVAGSFRTNWRSASEFTFQNGTRHFVLTVLH